MTQTGRTPTNRELMAARQAQAPIAPGSAVAKVGSPEHKTAVADYNADYKLRYLDEVAPSGIASGIQGRSE